MQYTNQERTQQMLGRGGGHKSKKDSLGFFRYILYLLTFIKVQESILKFYKAKFELESFFAICSYRQYTFSGKNCYELKRLVNHNNNNNYDYLHNKY